jgi:hypothetical protein
MRKLLPILLIAVAANALMAGPLYYFSHQASRLEEFATFIFSDLWISSVVISVIISIIRRKYLYKGIMILWTLLALSACTPILFSLIGQAMNPDPEVMMMQSKYDYPSGKVTNTEHWEYSGFGSHTFVDKHFIADSVDFARKEDAAFKRNGKWVFFSKKGDTVMVEYYSNGKLLEIKTPKKSGN